MSNNNKKNIRKAKRGSVISTILSVLRDGDKYGYEIIKDVEAKTGTVLKQPSLYSSLTRLENQGLIASYWTDSDIGGRRHYYKLIKDIDECDSESTDADTEENSNNDLESDKKIHTEPKENIKVSEISNYNIKSIFTSTPSKNNIITNNENEKRTTPINEIVDKITIDDNITSDILVTNDTINNVETEEPVEPNKKEYNKEYQINEIIKTEELNTIETNQSITTDELNITEVGHLTNNEEPKVKDEEIESDKNSEQEFFEELGLNNDYINNIKDTKGAKMENAMTETNNVDYKNILGEFLSDSEEKDTIDMHSEQQILDLPITQKNKTYLNNVLFKNTDNQNNKINTIITPETPKQKSRRNKHLTSLKELNDYFNTQDIEVKTYDNTKFTNTNKNHYITNTGSILCWLINFIICLTASLTLSYHQITDFNLVITISLSIVCILKMLQYAAKINSIEKAIYKFSFKKSLFINYIIFALIFAVPYFMNVNIINELSYYSYMIIAIPLIETLTHNLFTKKITKF